jgi:hypothetical protein
VWHTADTLHRVSAAAVRADLPRLVIRFPAVRAEPGCGSRAWSMKVSDRPVILNAAKGACPSMAPFTSFTLTREETELDRYGIAT